MKVWPILVVYLVALGIAGVLFVVSAEVPQGAQQADDSLPHAPAPSVVSVAQTEQGAQETTPEAIKPPAPPARVHTGTMAEPWATQYCTQFYTDLWGLQPVALGLAGPLPDLNRTVALWEAHFGPVEVRPWVQVAGWENLHALRDRNGGLAVVAFTDMAIDMQNGRVAGMACNGQAVVSLPGLYCPENLVMHEVGHLVGKYHANRGFMAPNVNCAEDYYE